MKGKRTSQFKNILGEQKSYKFTNVCLVSEVSEGRLIACNGSFIAASYSSSPGSIAIFDTAFPANVKFNTPILKGHKRSVFDLEFSPFKETILASGSDDATVKLWDIPSGGLRQNLSQDLMTYKGHTRRVSFVRFNPVASDVMASASTDYSLHVWNLAKGETYSKCEFSDVPTWLDWNSNGSLIGVTHKKKAIKVFDPRTNKSIFETQITESPRSSKFTWVGENTLVTIGFSKSNSKELKLWDIRKVNPQNKAEGPVQKLVIDNLTTITTPFYDHESKILYTSGKGELSVHTFDFNDSIIYPGLDFKAKSPALSINMFERKIVDYNKNEIDRFIHYNNNKEISFLSFYVARKNSGYEPALYPPLPSGEPALTYDQWISGENKDPVKKEIHTLQSNNANNTSDNNEIKKDGVGNDNAGNKKDNALEEKIKELEKKVNEKQAIYDKLLKTKTDLDNELKKVKKKKQEVNEKLNKALRQKRGNDKVKEKEKEKVIKEVKVEKKEIVKNVENVKPKEEKKDENKIKIEEVKPENEEKKENTMKIEEVKPETEEVKEENGNTMKIEEVKPETEEVKENTLKIEEETNENEIKIQEENNEKENEVKIVEENVENGEKENKTGVIQLEDEVKGENEEKKENEEFEIKIGETKLEDENNEENDQKKDELRMLQLEEEQ